MATLADLPEIDARLADAFGEPRWQPELDPLDELIAAIISQHTTWANCQRAFRELKARFGRWEAVRDAAVAEIAAAIRCAGLSRLKAPRIKRLLERISEERPDLDLRFLATLPVPEAMAWLRRLPGVGQNTAACTLLFGLGRPAMPVDTSICRICRRLGLTPPAAPPDAVQAALQQATAPDRVYPLHVNLIRFGRDICRPSHPLCHVCPLNDLCDYFQATRDQPTVPSPCGRGLG
jgi:endonuclease-3